MTDVKVTVGGSIADDSALEILANKFRAAKPLCRLTQNASDIACIFGEASSKDLTAGFYCVQGDALEEALGAAVNLGLSFSVAGISDIGNSWIEVFRPDSGFERMRWNCDVDGTPVADVVVLTRWQNEGRMAQMLEAMKFAFITPSEPISIGLARKPVL